MTNEFKALVVQQMRNVPLGPREKIIETKYFMSFAQESLTQMRAQKARTSGNQD
jgi:hypothetical protein